MPTSLSPVDQLAQLAETDMDALLEGLKFDSDASLQGMLPELARAYPVFVSTGDLPSLPPRSVALAAAAAGNDTVSFGATMTHSSVRWDDLDTQLLGEVLQRRLAHQVRRTNPSKFHTREPGRCGHVLRRKALTLALALPKKVAGGK